MANAYEDMDYFQPIQVFVRIRPLNESEKRACNYNILNVKNNFEVNLINCFHQKKYNFDRVFNITSTQKEVYTSVVSPLITEVMAGYNCTVVAYGQAGSGKTYTIVGDRGNPNISWQDDDLIGCILRAGIDVFNCVREMNVVSVDVTFIELYNEELKDLLNDDEGGQALKLFEDVNQKGSVSIVGAKIMTVHNEEDIYKLLKKGLEKRQTESHYVFNIHVNLKEIEKNGKIFIKSGKLCFVDLAGSKRNLSFDAKNIGTYETSNTNQSLLTLGRVIKAIAKKSSHVPYRDSKLTRILQDSLGGNTQTSIIATVSISSKSSEETINTLECVSNARNIINSPKINENESIESATKELQRQINKLQENLRVLRKGEGNFIDSETCNKLTEKNTNYKKQLNEKRLVLLNRKEKLRHLIIEIEKKGQDIDSVKELLNKHNDELKETKKLINEYKIEIEKEKFISDYYKKNEEKVMNQTEQLQTAAETFTEYSVYFENKIVDLNEKLSVNKKVADDVVMHVKNTSNDLTTITNNYNNKINLNVVDNINYNIHESVQEIRSNILSVASIINELNSKNEQETLFNTINQHLMLNDESKKQIKDFCNIENNFKQDVCETIIVIQKALENYVKKPYVEDIKRIRIVTSNLTEYILNYKKLSNKFISDTFQDLNSHQKCISNELNILKDKLISDKNEQELIRKELKKVHEKMENFKKKAVKHNYDYNNLLDKIDNMKSVHLNYLKATDDKILNMERKLQFYSKNQKEFTDKIERQMCVRNDNLLKINSLVTTEIDDKKQQFLNMYSNIIKNIDENVENYIQKSTRAIKKQNTIIQKFKNDMNCHLNAFNVDEFFDAVNSTVIVKNKLKIMDDNYISFTTKMNDLNYNTNKEIEEVYSSEWEEIAPTGETPKKRNYNVPEAVKKLIKTDLIKQLEDNLKIDSKEIEDILEKSKLPEIPLAITESSFN